jgi:hypothetical protein
LAIGGVSWLTFAVPPLARALSPYNYGPGILAEGALTVWLLVNGVTTARPLTTHANGASRGR